MRRAQVIAGLGGITFSVCLLVAETLSNAPGGNYSRSDVTQYLAGGHQSAVFVAGYLGVVSAVGLIAMAGYLRELLRPEGGDSRAANLFWGAGLVSAASFVAGWAILTAIVAAHAQGAAGLASTPAITYLISELGVMMILGSGGIMLGVALIVFALALRQSTAVPTWLRRLTLVAGVGGLAAPALFPAVLLVIWGLAMGGWMIAGGRGLQPVEARAQTAA